MTLKMQASFSLYKIIIYFLFPVYFGAKYDQTFSSPASEFLFHCICTKTGKDTWDIHIVEMEDRMLL